MLSEGIMTFLLLRCNLGCLHSTAVHIIGSRCYWVGKPEIPILHVIDFEDGKTVR